MLRIVDNSHFVDNVRSGSAKLCILEPCQHFGWDSIGVHVENKEFRSKTGALRANREVSFVLQLFEFLIFRSSHVMKIRNAVLEFAKLGLSIGDNYVNKLIQVGQGGCRCRHAANSRDYAPTPNVCPGHNWK